ncbi:thioredoxin [Nitzschia inconspicua]|uniref:Thioredoxin n=1 Tax=Nitzschia inconspicua TaxID=303405 RepID=A0A9K3Q0M2_9STRA|nr:thioredoxin [Nitzschia inconspicua]
MKGGVSSVAAHSASTSFSTGKTKTTTEDSTTTTKATSYSTLSYDVIDLTSANFAATVNDGNVWLIEFYTSWCSHCQNFKASYENVALTFHSSPQEKIRVAKVDCSVEKALATRFGVRGYPSFYLVSGWTVYEFEDDRSETNLISFARGGYKRQDPIPWVSSPMGPMGILQGALIFVGMTIMGFLDILQTRFGIHPILAGLGICVIGIVGGMISIVLLTILSTPREKVE